MGQLQRRLSGFDMQASTLRVGSMLQNVMNKWCGVLIPGHNLQSMQPFEAEVLLWFCFEQDVLLVKKS